MNDLCVKYYGKHQGRVVSNVDPEQRGRLLVQVPDVTGEDLSTWALPCMPVGGLRNGMFALPAVGSQVWVEYEQGDSDYPVWVGSFWGQGEAPPLALDTPPGVGAITLQTPLQNGLTISDLPGPSGGIQIRSAGGATLIVNDTGIYVDNGKGAKVTLIGPTVDVNDGALKVT